MGGSGSVALERIREYYQETEGQYRRAWSLDKGMALHFGYWERGVWNHRQSVRRMNEIIAQKAHIERGEQVADFGCGVGGTAIMLARDWGCRAAGCTISERQVELARANARRFGVENAVSFAVADYAATPYSDKSFDAVLMLESACHAADKRALLSEVARVLKTGGRAVFSDFMVVRQPRAGEEQALLAAFESAWVVSFAEPAAFHSLLAEAGFANIAMHDATAQIMPTSLRWYFLFLCSYAFHRISGRWRRLNAVQKANFFSGKYQYELLKRGILRYRIVSAQKTKTE